jgi:hypothetical protein
VKRPRGDKPIGVVILICMERTQGIFLCICLYLKLAKMPCFFFNLLCFFYKIGEPEGRTVSVGVVWHQWEGGGAGERR